MIGADAVGNSSSREDVDDRRNEAVHERGYDPAVPAQRDGRGRSPGTAEASQRSLQRKIDLQEGEIIGLRRRVCELEKESRDLRARTAKLESTKRVLETQVQQQQQVINRPRRRPPLAG